MPKNARSKSMAMHRMQYRSLALGKIAVIGNYTPRMCGIATFTEDTCKCMAAEMGADRVYAVAMDDVVEGYPYPEMVRLQLRDDVAKDYASVADYMNYNNTEVVLIQHEYGIYGGAAGEHLLEMMRDLHMPIITNMHTVLSHPNDDQRRVTEEIIQLSSKVVVMTEYAKKILKEVYDIPDTKLAMIPHGIPDVSFIDPNYYKDNFGVEGRDVILTFGLLSSGKGIEVAIKAMADVVKKHPRAVYICLGKTHPHVKRDHGEEYRESLVALTKELGLEDNVIFVDEFVSLEKLCEYIGSADVYVTPYHNAEQITSGTLAYAAGAGKPVVSTPYRHAEELLAEGRGILFPFGDSKALAENIVHLLDDAVHRHSIRKKAYHQGRDMVWSAVGKSYAKIFQEAFEERGQHPRTMNTEGQVTDGMMTLPKIDLRYIYAMTDDTGIFQHATYSIPNRFHGYCVDDNARALIAVSNHYGIYKDDNVLPLVRNYISFIHAAFDDKVGRFRNFLSYDRKWLEKAGSEDSHGRALWSLGVVASSSLSDDITRPAACFFVDGLPAVEKFSSPRSWMFALIGIEVYLRRFGGDAFVKGMRKTLAKKLYGLYEGNASEDWPWFEDILTYANARFPQALLVAGKGLENDAMIKAGLKSLQWLLDIQTSEKGHITIVGNAGWKERNKKKSARFDQQPIDAGALVEACVEAYRVTKDRKWVTEASRCFRWFLGYNDLQVPLYDPITGGCCDGLQVTGPNRNQGAESTLAWFLALLKLHTLPSDVFFPEEIPEKNKNTMENIVEV